MGLCKDGLNMNAGDDFARTHHEGVTSPGAIRSLL